MTFLRYYVDISGVLVNTGNCLPVSPSSNYFLWSLPINLRFKIAIGILDKIIFEESFVYPWEKHIKYWMWSSNSFICNNCISALRTKGYSRKLLVV